MNEKEHLDQLQTFLEKRRFKCWREVIPDECEFWTLPLKIDLIFYRDDTGFIAIEGKVVNTYGQGGVVADAFEQIKKYKNLTYFKGNKINKWCIYLTTNTEYANSQTLVFISTFLQRYGVKILQFIKYSNPEWNRVCIGKNDPDSLTIDSNGEIR